MKTMRKWHRILSLVSAAPLLLTICTGVLLILRSHLSFIQPEPIKQKIFLAPQFISTIEQVIQKSQEQYQFSSDPKMISSIIYYPSKGYFSVRTKTNRELRLHGQTLEVLTEGPKYTSFLIQLHEGSFFGSFVKNFIFTPAAFTLLFLLFSGLYIGIKFYRQKRFTPRKSK